MPHFEVDLNWNYEGDEVEIVRDVIIVNGDECEVEMIRHKGVTFVKTRDVAKALGFEIGNKGRIPVFTK